MDADESLVAALIDELTVWHQLLSVDWKAGLGMANDDQVLNEEADHARSIVLFALIPIVVAFAYIVFILYRSRREAYFRERETSLKLSMSELELKVLRAQINPHFIFNCLNSIHHFMHRHDVEKASEYLIKFSRVIRHVLETSYDRMTPLSDDIATLKAYVELEQVRTRGSFTFQIDVDESISMEEVHIPPLLIQPFVENAIWHGLSHQDTGGRITVTIERAEDMLKCSIWDNGRKSEAKEPYDLAQFVKRNSRGMSLIEGRLNVINRLYKSKSGFIAERQSDGTQDGTRVALTLPYED